MNNDSDHSLREKLASLPREISPPRDLWPEINAQLSTPSAHAVTADLPRRVRSFWWPRIALAAAAIVLITTALVLLRRPTDSVNWAIASLSGTPRVDSRAITATGQWRRGQWLETDASSRASLTIGSIGEVRLEPDSRVRLLGTDADNHRLELARGTLHALIWAPPRLFFVETPSSTAVDLGCAYSLTVDDAGAGTLHVTAGYVALEHQGRESLVPAGWLCRTRPGTGPGTPFSESASPELRSVLEQFDFGPGQSEVLAGILTLSTRTDAITLWHLLTRVDSRQREAVFEKLATLHPTPSGVTREGILRGDKTMLTRWAEALGLSPVFAAGQL